MKNTIICSLVIVLCISCFHDSEEKCGKDNLLSVNITEKPIMLSDLYDNAEFVPFENGEKCMLSRVKKTIVKNGCVILLDKDPYATIKVFSTNGEYIRNIGQLGHGKGEYVDIDDFTMNNNGDSIFVLCNNRILVYDNKGTFLFSKDFDIKGVIRRIESCNGGYVCLTEYKGNDYLLHFLDYDFNIKKNIISSGGRIIKEPSEVINPIQVNGKDVWYYNCFNSTFYVVDTDNDYAIKKYRINTDKAYKIEQFDNYVYTNDYDAISNFCVIDSMVFGTMHTSQSGSLPFYWNLNCNEIVVKSPEGWIPNVNAVNTNLYCSIIEQDVFIGLSKQMIYMRKIQNNYQDVSGYINEKNNFILVKLNPKK
ncbi:MAG: 6-bladed beta-propeller [Bacteroidaceae bacterium]|nr:6-bladed beta-propeller [Bacteroidaceae bacterium]